jgi:anti-sigma regulatory factor (Ser/Thr protein kinase)
MTRDWTRTAAPEAVAFLRTAVCDFGTGAGMVDRLMADVRIALSEALTNAVIHGYREVASPGDVVVSATVEDGTMWIVVKDRGCGFKPRLDSPGLGFGLPMIAELSDSFDIVPVMPTGTEIRMTFDRPAAA